MMRAAQTTLEHFYWIGIEDREHGAFIRPTGELCARAYRDGWTAADRLERVLTLADVLMDGREVPDSLVSDVRGEER